MIRPRGSDAPPLEWSYQISRREAVAIGRQFILPIALRGLTWAILVVIAELGLLHLIAPPVEIPIGKVTLAAVAVLVVSLLIPLTATAPVRHRVDEKGLFVNGRSAFRWKGAVGFAVRFEPEETLLLVGEPRGLVRVPMPKPPTREALLGFVRDRLRPLTPAEESAYGTPVAFTWVEVMIFSLLSFGFAVAAGALGPVLLKRLPVWLALIGELVVCLPPGVVAAWYATRRFGYPRLGRAVLIGATMFTTGLAMPLIAAFVAKSLGQR